MKKQLFLMLACLMGALSGWAQEVVIDNIHYELYDHDGKTEARVVGINEGVETANILEQVTYNEQSYTVTSIDGATSTLKHVYIPKTATYIGQGCFGENMETITIDPDNPVYDSRDNCNAIIEKQDNKTYLVLPCSTIPSSVKTIGRVTVWGHYENFIIPDGVETIEEMAFNYGNYEPGIIENISISKSVKNIGENPWWWSVANVSIDKNNPYYYSQGNCVFEKNTKKLVATGVNAAIPSDISIIGNNALFAWAVNETNYLTLNQEYPQRMDVGGIAERSIILQVPEGLIPCYIYQGWGNYFKQITDGIHTYYGSDRVQGDTWYAPHIEAVDFTAEQAGEEVTFSVVLNADQPVTAFQFDLYLPEGMEMTFDEDDYENILLSTARTTERKHTLTSQQMPDGAWRVICYSDKNYTFEGNEGEVCTVRVKTSTDMANGGYPITFKNITTTYVDGEGKGQIQHDIITTYVNFFTPDFPSLGDANGDKQVNVTDITTVVSYILGNNPSKFVFALADAYQDGTINVTDITAIVDIIMNESQPNQAPRRNARRNARMRADEETTTASLEVIPFAIAPGEEKEVEVVLNNPDDAFTGLQFDLALPEGISLVSDEDGYFVSLGSRTTSRKHTIEAQQRADGTIRVMAYSNRNSNFSGTEGDVVVLTLKADDNLAGGVYDLQLKDIVLSQANGNEINQIEPADYEGSILSGTLAENPVIKGDITAEAANAISAAVTKDVTHIDLTLAAKVADDAVFTTANLNTLILAAAGTQNASKNVVAGDVCANLVLSDASAFAAPKTFTASQVSFSTNVNAYKTLTLPFNADVPEGFSASNATSVTGTTVNLESTSTINANSPVMIEGEGPLELKAANAVVKATGDAAFTNGMLSGTFKSIPAPVGSYVLQKHSGTTGFYLVADVQPTVGAFRAILNVPETGVKLYTFDDEATGISLTPALSEEGATYYNVSGQRMSRMQKGINIVNGKKILY